MSDIKAVIFDLDGTLYSYNKADDAACEALGRYVSQHFGMDPGNIKQEIRECWDIQNDRIGFLCGATHNRLIRCQVICERNGWPVFPHALNMAKTYWGAFLEGMIPEDGIKELLSALRKTGVDIALGSNMTSYIQYLKLMQIGLEDCRSGYFRLHEQLPLYRRYTEDGLFRSDKGRHVRMPLSCGKHSAGRHRPDEYHQQLP